MKMACIVIVLSIGFSSWVSAQQTPKKYSHEDYRYRFPAPEYYRQQRMAEIEKQVADYSKAQSPYRKFEDGEIVYLGKLLYEREGIVPKATNSTVRLEINTFRVLDVSSNGCRIAFISFDSRTGIENPEPDIFVEGLTGYSDRKYHETLIIKQIGDYQYKTVNGSTRLIPRYSLGKDATKEQYLEYAAKLSQKGR